MTKRDPIKYWVPRILYEEWLLSDELFMTNVLELISALINGVLIGSIYALITTGLTLCFGVMGILNFAHGSIVMLGMYSTYCFFVYLGLDPYVSIILVIPIFFIFGLLLQRSLFYYTLEAPAVNQFLVGIGLLIFLNNLAHLIFSANVRTIQVPILEQNFSAQGIILSYSRLLAFIVSIVCYIVLIAFLKKSYFGKAIRATAQNRQGAKICGINIYWIYLITFGIGTALAGISGVILLPFLAVHPDIGDNFILIAFIIIVLGGIGQIGGTFWAAMLIGVAEALGGTYMSSSLKYLAPFIIFILVLLFRPSGLFSKGN